MGRVEPDLVDISDRPYHGTPREGSDTLSMQPVGYTPWCSTDAVAISDVGTVATLTELDMMYVKFFL